MSGLNSFVYSGIPFEMDRTTASYRRGLTVQLPVFGVAPPWAWYAGHLAQAFVACCTNTNSLQPEMKILSPSELWVATFIGRGTCNEIPGLYDKISITIVPSYTGNLSLICHLWHCYSCFALITILRQQTCDIFRYSFVLL